MQEYNVPENNRYFTGKLFKIIVIFYIIGQSQMNLLANMRLQNNLKTVVRILKDESG